MSRFILDANNRPRRVQYEEYRQWKNALPPDDRTGIGKRVDWDEIDEYQISTVFLGHDTNEGFPGGQFFFETMVFKGGQDVDCERHSTWQAAVEGHAVMIRKYEVIAGYEWSI